MIRALVIVSLIVGAIAGIVTPFVADLHIYRVTSGYSGQQFWLSFPHPPSEETLLDAVIYREFLIREPFETTRAWRRAQKENTRLFIKKDSNTSVLVMPYENGEDPNLSFADGGRSRGVWLTEPSTRSELPVFLAGLAYVVGAFLAATTLTFVAVVSMRWAWYFLLRRISELVQVIKGKT